MKNLNQVGRVVLLGAAFAMGATGACVPGRAQNLPDAPPAPASQQPLSHIPVPATRPPDPEALNHRQWSSVVQPGEKIPALTDRNKLAFPLHEELNLVTTVIPDLYSGGYGVWRNTDPRYGTDSAGFGDRVGIAAVRQAVTREFADGLLPVLLHEDPRYYRRAYGSYDSRGEYAIRRVFVTQADAGNKVFNFSDILGRGMSAALTQAYYPEDSKGAGVVFRTWGYSLVALGAGNLFEEFWPDVRHKFFHK